MYPFNFDVDLSKQLEKKYKNKKILLDHDISLHS